VTQKYQKVSEASLSQTDDFKLIHGIKQGIAKRLYEAGIHTYAQLASLSPQEIQLKLGNVIGFSVKRIENDDWIGQARKLIPEKAPQRSGKKGTTKSLVRQHYENFTIEFLLDEKNRARRTRVVHVQSGDSDTWSRWEADRVMDFIARHARVRKSHIRPADRSSLQPIIIPKPSIVTEVPSKMITAIPTIAPEQPPQKELNSSTYIRGKTTQPIPAPTGEGIPEKSQQPISPKVIYDSIGAIRVREWKLSLSDTDQPLRNIPHDQAFDVCLILDLDKLTLTDTLQFYVRTTLYAKRLGGNKRSLIAETQEIKPFDRVLTLTVSHLTLPRGVYRLEAMVNLNSDGLKTKSSPAFTTLLESSPLQVY